MRRPQRPLLLLRDGMPIDETREPATPLIIRMPIAGFLAWLVPGLGHIYLGHRGRGLICLVTIVVTFWTGVAIGGVQSTVAPKARKLWFVAQLGTGGNTLAAYALHYRVNPETARASRLSVFSHWSSADVGVHYTGVAGLLNLLVIFDAVARAEAPLVRRRSRANQRSALPRGGS